jgi:hemolysin III
MEGYQHYSVAEERANIISHALGVVFSVVALIMMVLKASLYGNIWHIVSVTIFGLSLTALYIASTMYHSTSNPVKRAHLRIVDHATIYVLIAGTYTPFTLVTLAGPTGWSIFAVSWSMAVAGIVLKLFFTGRFNALSTALYVLMGWIIVVALEPLRANLSGEGVSWLFGGGVAYTTGAVIYSIKKIKFNHAIFHLFVLLGSFCHVVSVYLYVLPDA